MTKDANEMVLDAFRVEHKEQLEQIRTLIASWRADVVLTNDDGVREAFRLAHSLKGGARVCGLREAEQLGHGLESVLEKLHHGELTFNKSALATITVLLDSIEDWMAALDRQQSPPDVSEALDSIAHLLAKTVDPSESTPNLARTKQLLPVFLQEHDQHSARIRQFLAGWRNTADSLPGDELLEAARVAHTLAGAAAVVQIRTIETLATQLEQIFRAARANQQRLDAAARQKIDETLDCMARAAQDAEEELEIPSAKDLEGRERRFKTEVLPELKGDVVPAVGQLAHRTSSMPQVASFETVRITLDSLDRLMRSSSEMLADNQQVARFARQLTGLQGDVDELERERESIRRAALPTLHQLAELPEFNRISKYLEFVDRQVSCVAKRTRQLSVEHRRVAWQLRTRSAQIQRDVHEARLVPAHSIFQGFRKMVRDLATSEGKQIEFQAAGMDVRADRMVLQELKDPVMHVLRNCVSHGIERPGQRQEAGKPEAGRVSIRLDVSGGRLNVAIEDDGRGIDVQKLQDQAIRQGLLSESRAAEQSTEDALSLVFMPGFTTAQSVTELAGRGMGLSIVHDAVSRLQGNVAVSLRPEGGVRVATSVPIFISTHRILLVACGEQTIAIPTHGIERLLRIPQDKVETMEGQPVVTYERRPVRLIRLQDLLGLPESPSAEAQPDASPVVLLKSGTRLLAVSVDALVEERDALILGLDEFAEAKEFAGGILLDDGRVALLIQPQVLMENVQRSRAPQRSVPRLESETVGPAKVLIVDDSFTTRTLEKNILEAQGYEVSVAIDGVEAMALLRQQKFALVITDIEMPRMDGFVLIEQMKADRRLSKTPVILVTSRDRQEDQQHGLDLGADAYIVKRKFDHQELLSTIRQLI